MALHEEFDDWAVLFQPATGEAVGIAPVGVTIWKLVDGRRTVSEIAAEVAARYEEVPDTVVADTAAFIEDLRRRLFVTVRDPR